MKKSLTILVLTLATAAIFTGCEAKKEPAVPDKSDAAEAPATPAAPEAPATPDAPAAPAE